MRRRPLALALLVHGLVAAAAMAEEFTPEIDQPAECIPLAEPSPDARPPWVFWGMTSQFERRVLDAFPVGSCEHHLIAWMDEMEFEETLRSWSEAVFVDEPQEMERTRQRRQSSEVINMRRLVVSAPIGRSYFSIAWKADADGRLLEVYPDTRLWHFDVP